MDQVEFYQAKLSFEIDSWDLSEAIKKGALVVVVDARANEAYETEHIPSSINIPHRTMTVETTK